LHQNFWWLNQPAYSSSEFDRLEVAPKSASKDDFGLLETVDLFSECVVIMSAKPPTEGSMRPSPPATAGIFAHTGAGGHGCTRTEEVIVQEEKVARIAHDLGAHTVKIAFPAKNAQSGFQKN